MTPRHIEIEALHLRQSLVVLYILYFESGIDKLEST